VRPGPRPASDHIRFDVRSAPALAGTPRQTNPMRSAGPAVAERSHESDVRRTSMSTQS